MGPSPVSPSHGAASSKSLSGSKRSSPGADVEGDSEGSKGSVKLGQDAALSRRKRVKRDDGSLSAGEARGHSGWNPGVSSGGFRTSFSAASKDRIAQASSHRALGSPVRQDADSPRNGPAAATDVGDLVLPPGDASFSKRPSHGTTWQSRFESWCIQLMALNRSREGFPGAALIRDAWEAWLQTRVSLHPIAREAALQAAAETNLDAEKLEELVTQPLKSDPGPAPEAGQVETDRSWGVHTPDEATSVSDKAAPQAVHQAGNWIVPPPPSRSWHSEVKQKDQSAWEEKFVAWCKSVAHLNENRVRVDTPRDRNRLIESYSKWIGTVDGLSNSKAAAARRAATHYAHANNAQVAAALADTSTRPPSDTPAVDTASSVGMDVPPSETAVTPSTSSALGDATPAVSENSAAYRERYFPGIDPDEIFCVMCASRDHDSAGCPDMICRFCHDAGHPSFSCPTRMRCTKCRQLGHSKQDCSEKLALAPEEMDCAFCQSREHLDVSCPVLWRSFSINPDTARKVRALPIYCYCCGYHGHNGPDCGLNTHNPKGGLWETWSRSNCDRYLDPSSSEVAIAFAASSGSAPDGYGRPDLGKSIVPRRHIVFEEADDDEETENFIRPPVQKNTRPGQIKFAGDNGGTNRGGRRPGKQFSAGNVGPPGYAQPPLPPGPPPPLPPQAYPQDNRRNGGRRGKGAGRGRY